MRPKPPRGAGFARKGGQVIPAAIAVIAAYALGHIHGWRSAWRCAEVQAATIEGIKMSVELKKTLAFDRLKPEDVLPKLFSFGVPQHCTWPQQAAWVRATFPQQSILAAYIRIFESIEPEDTERDDKLRDDLDILFYAMETKTIGELEKYIGNNGS